MLATFGDALRAVRCTHGLTIRALATRAHVSPGHLSDLESGRRPPTPAVAAAVDRALGLDGGLVSLLALPQPVAVNPLTVGEVPGIHARILTLAAQDTAHGADGLWRSTAAWYRTLRTRCAAVTHPEVIAAVAEVGQLAAWLAHDASRDALCRRLLLEALADADAVGAPIRWLILEQSAMLAAWTGRPAESLRHADRALTTTPPPAVEGMLRMRRARALAELDQHGEARREVAAAYDLLAAGPTAADPGWAWWLHEAEAELHAGAVWSALGEHHRALTCVHAAVDGLPAGQRRDVAVYRARLACAQGAAGDWSGVLDTAAGTAPKSARARAELLRAGWGGPAEVRAALAA